MNRWALLVILSLCIALQSGDRFSVPGFGSGYAWAGKGGSDKDSDDDDNDNSGQGKLEPGKFESGKSGEQRKLGALRDAVRKQKILPFSKLKSIVVERFGANIVDVEIEREDGQWIYEFKVISQSGRLVEVYLNAETGRIISVEND
ncbi:MAG: PepSY domain-containing protein [Salaquimonas sp.]